MFDLESIIIILVLMLLILTGFILVYLRLKKGSDNLTTVMFGAIYEFFNRQQREQVEQVVEHKVPNIQTQSGQDQEKEREKSEHQEIHKYEKQDSPGSKSFIHRVAPRKMMRK